MVFEGREEVVTLLIILDFFAAFDDVHIGILRVQLCCSRIRDSGTVFLPARFISEDNIGGDSAISDLQGSPQSILLICSVVVTSIVYI